MDNQHTIIEVREDRGPAYLLSGEMMGEREALETIRDAASLAKNLWVPLYSKPGSASGSIDMSDGPNGSIFMGTALVAPLIREGWTRGYRLDFVGTAEDVSLRAPGFTYTITNAGNETLAVKIVDAHGTRRKGGIDQLLGEIKQSASTHLRLVQ